jgi:hypothetical protein
MAVEITMVSPAVGGIDTKSKFPIITASLVEIAVSLVR